MRKRIIIAMVLIVLIVLVSLSKTTALFLPRVTYHDSFKINSSEYDNVIFYQFKVVELITKEKELVLVRYNLEGNNDGEYINPYISVTVLENRDVNLSKYTKHIYKVLGKKYPISFNQVPFKTPALINGKIETVDLINKKILVKSVEDSEYYKHPFSCWVKLNNDSIIRDLSYNTLSISDLKIDNQVEVYTNAEVLETDPLQALGYLVILKK